LCTVGSTKLATTQPPAEVVGLLNEFFRIVVETVNRDGGFVNKFQGDAALAIFGAPLEHPDRWDAYADQWEERFSLLLNYVECHDHGGHQAHPRAALDYRAATAAVRGVGHRRGCLPPPTSCRAPVAQ
jgi:class 3 adenylate cyclase